MKKLLEGNGVPVRKANDSGTPGVAPPTAWSSGRVTGKAER
jgi:hypothetical protein